MIEITGERTAPMSAKGSASRILDHQLLALSILSSVLCYYMTISHLQRKCIPHSSSLCPSAMKLS